MNGWLGLGGCVEVLNDALVEPPVGCRCEMRFRELDCLRGRFNNDDWIFRGIASRGKRVEVDVLGITHILYVENPEFDLPIAWSEFNPTD